MVRILFPRLAAFFAFAVLLFSSSNNALASACDTLFFSNYQNCVQFGGIACSPYSSPEEYRAAHPHCFSGSSSSSQAQVNGTSFQQIGVITSVLQSRLLANSGPIQFGSAPVQGLAAGGKNAWNVWGNIGESDTNQSYSLGANSIRYNLGVVNSVIGVDYALAPGMVVGVSGAFDRGEGIYRSNANAAFGSTSKGYAIAPYIGYQLSKELALDGSVGFGSGKVYSAGGAESKADRLFYAANLGYSSWIKDLQLTGKLGYLHGEEEYGDTRVGGILQGNTAALTRLDRWQVGGQLGYWFSSGVQPYVSATYFVDRRASSAASTDLIGRTAWQWAVGLNIFSLSNGITGGVAYIQEDSRTNQRSNSAMANIGIRF